MMRSFLCLITLVFFIKMTATAQVSGKAVVDSASMFVGDQMRLRLELSVSKTTELKPLDLSVVAADSVFEILSESKWDTVGTSADKLRLQKNMLLIAWDSGYYSIPSIPIPYKYGGKNDTFYTRKITMKIDFPQVDTTLADIKPILKEPLKFQDFLMYVIGAVLLVLLALFLILRKRKPVTMPDVPPKIQLLPHELALQQLEILNQQRLWQSGNVKGYHSALTYIVREYLEKRYGIQALEQTTDEILAQLRQRDFDLSLSQRLGNVLQTADLVKFAKAQPTAEFHEQAMGYARGFVVETKPTEEQIHEMKAMVAVANETTGYGIEMRQNPELAGFWQRCFARIIDLVALYLTLQIALLIFAYMRSNGININKIFAWLVPFVFVFVYHILLEFKTGSTVGKMILGIKVKDLQGNSISFGQSFLRTLCKFVFSELLVVGYAFYFFDKRQRQTLHDKIAQTIVVKRQKTTMVLSKPKMTA